MKQKKRYIIEVADGKYLDGCAWSQFTNQAKLFSKKKKAHEWLGRLIPYNPEAQILKYNPTSGCYKPLKQKTKLQPVTDSKTARANTDNAFPLDEALGRFYTGINYLATSGVLGVRGQMILTKSTTSYRDKKKALLDIGWELKEHPDDGYLWSFSWGQPSTVELTKKQGGNIAKGYTILEKYGLASVHITPQEHQVSRENRLKETTVTPEDMEILKSLGWRPDSRINTGWKYLETLTPSVMGKVKLEPVTDSEARLLDSSEVARWHFARGLELLGGNYDSYNREDGKTTGKTIVCGKPTEGDFNKLVSRMRDHGFKLGKWGTMANWEWSFDWNRWEAETKETEAEADSIHSVCDCCFDSGHTEAHCPQKVSKSGQLERMGLDVC